MDRYRLLKIATAAEGTKLIDLARRWGVRHPSIVQVAQGIRRSRRLEGLLDTYLSETLQKTGVRVSGSKAA